MQPRIETLGEKKLIGKRMEMSFSDNRTAELWRSFMPRRREIKNSLSAKLFSMQVYDRAFSLESIDYNQTFEKWAAVEVHDFESIPTDLEPFVLPAGLYAVFTHKGPASAGPTTFRYIFGTWLPHCPYVLDQRPHFELLGEKYKNEDPESEEEFWIPVKAKNNLQ